jgi:Resolvase, N terminal domain
MTPKSYDRTAGNTFDRPGLKALLDYARSGDALAVVRLDRLGRSLRELLDVVETLKGRGIALVSLEEKIDTSSAAGELVFHVLRNRPFRATPDRRAYPRRHRRCSRRGSQAWTAATQSAEVTGRRNPDPQRLLPQQSRPPGRPRQINAHRELALMPDNPR